MVYVYEKYSARSNVHPSENVPFWSLWPFYVILKFEIFIPGLLFIENRHTKV